MKFFVGSRPPPSSWDLLESWLDELIFEKLWKRFERWGKIFLIRASVVIAIFIFFALSFLPARITKSAILSVPGIHETYEWLFLNKSENMSAESIRKQLGYLGGNFALSFIYSLDSVKTEEERTQILNDTDLLGPQIIGFETINIPDDKLANILRETIPKGFLYNVKKIIYEDRESASLIMIFYGFSFKPTSSANPLTKNITVFCQWNAIQIKIVRELLAHEIAHLNDWNSNSLLSREERLKILCDVLERLGAKDRYVSCYVEYISPKNESLKKYMRATEYWAEINGEYMSPVGEARNLPPKDTEIIEDVLQKMDPCYFQKIDDWQRQSR